MEDPIVNEQFTPWNFNFEVNRAPVATEIVNRINEVLQEKYQNKFLTVVPLGSSIYNWKFKKAFGFRKPYIGDFECGIIIDTYPKEEYPMINDAFESWLQILKTFNIQADFNFNPLTTIFNLNHEYKIEKELAVSAFMGDTIAMQKLCIPFLQDSAYIAQKAYKKLLTITEELNVSNQQLFKTLIYAFKNAVIPRINHIGLSYEYSEKTATVEERKLVKIYERIVEERLGVFKHWEGKNNSYY